jgi:hypothetical protein
VSTPKIVQVDPNNFKIIEVGQQGPPGPPGADGISNVDVSKENNDTQDLVIGTPVYLSGLGTVKRANAATALAKDIAGFVTIDPFLQQATFGFIRISGILTATTVQWDVVTGMVGGLVPNANYYLDSNVGRITHVPPNTEGHFLCRVGQALNSTDLLIRIEPPIWL